MPFRLYAMITWTTRGRMELIDREGAQFLQHFLPPVARRNGAELLATGIVADHVHLLVRLGHAFDVPRLVQGLKGASARVANRDGVMRRRLRWASGYDLRSVSPQGLAAARAYLANQAMHHPDRQLRDAPAPDKHPDAGGDAPSQGARAQRGPSPGSQPG